MNSKKINRRKAILGISATAGGTFLLNPLSILFESVVKGAMNDALAEELGIAPRNYVLLQFSGAPPRWHYDLPLAPYGDHSKIIKNTSLGTKFVERNGRYVDIEYKTTPISIPGGGTLHMPWIWQFDIPTSDGKSRPMSDLLKDMMIMRGINIGNPAHFGAQSLQFRPGSKVSIGSLSADRSEAPIPAINFGCSNYSFVSSNGLSAVPLSNSGNVIKALLDPFVQSNSSEVISFRGKRNKLFQAIKEASGLLDESAKNIHSEYFDVKRATDSAKKLLERSFNDIESYWDEAVARYSNLLGRAVHQGTKLRGINDKPVGLLPVSKRNKEYSGVTRDDLRSVSRPRQVAENFALIEYVLTNKLSSSISVNSGRLDIAGKRIGFDEHGTGRMLSTIANAYQARCNATAMLELVNQLKSAQIFDETIIQSSPEFGRKPRDKRDEDSGSDHAPGAGVCSFYGGAIKGYEVIGNISSKGAEYWKYPGTWGSYASNKNKDGSNFGILSARHIASTVASMLRTPSPVSNATPSVVIEENGVISSRLEKAKIV